MLPASSRPHYTTSSRGGGGRQASRRLSSGHIIFSFAGRRGTGSRHIQAFRTGMPPFTTRRWWDGSTVAVVTGGNKGIGLEIARNLASEGLITVLTARNEELGAKAAKKVAADTGGCVVFHQLDISNSTSVQNFGAWLKETHGGLTILVNNAGIAYKGSIFGADELKVTLDTNFRGTAAVCGALKDQFQPGGRIVNVGSRAGKLSIVKNAKLRVRFEAAQSMADVEALATAFQNAVAIGSHQKEGWPNSMYGISKLCLGMYTRTLAKEMTSSGVAVNVCCPGWCATDMSSHSGPNTAKDGADTPTWLALMPNDGPTGQMFAGRRECPF